MPLIQGILDSERFMPHGMCYLWEPELLTLHVASDGVTGLSYFAISVALVVLVYRSARIGADEAPGMRRIPFWWMFVAFGVFIVACGATHLLGVWTVWRPDYWISGGVKGVTAVFSLATAVALPPLIPRVLDTLREARKSEARKRELETTNAELRSAHERIKELDELKTQFFANVSHELRTPLTLISGPTGRLLSREDLSEEEREELEVVARNARLLKRHVSDILDTTRLAAGEMEPDYRRVDLARLSREVAEAFRGVAQERDQEFQVRTPDELTAEVDPDMVERVLLNLLSNAFKFTPTGGTVRLVLREGGDTAEGGSDGDDGSGTRHGEDAPHAGSAETAGELVIQVRDSGSGIPEEQREAIFERFRQVEGTTSRPFGGTGLGLAIVRDLVTLQGGSVSVGDAPEGGALVEIRLPRHAPAGAEVTEGEGRAPRAADLDAAEMGLVTEPPVAGSDAEPARETPSAGDARPVGTSRTAEPAAAEAEGTPAPPHVLVVEDSADMSRFVSGLLEPEYRVTTATDGEDALERIGERTPDLILSDIMMPGMSGDELLREVRSRAGLEGVPFLFLTARADDELKVRMFREGAQDYITKPFLSEEVRARIGNWTAVARARKLLRRELGVPGHDVEALAGELAARTSELARALEAERIAREEETRASRRKTELLGTVSHELRTPLNAILGYADLLRTGVDGRVTEAQDGRLARIETSARHLKELIEHLLELSAVETGDARLEWSEVPVTRITEEVGIVIEHEAAAAGLSFRVVTPPDPGTLVTDPGRLRQVLFNLLSNAVKFTHEGEVRLEVEADADRVGFVVVDTGPGIEPEDRPRVFDPFWQGPEPDEDATGVGLGLSIAHRLVERLGGTLTLESEPGDGTRFVVELPRRPGNGTD